tara:strand:- start:166 stop:459 length:294 start_codon:yes stop_codon:yes gene_type:complete
MNTQIYTIRQYIECRESILERIKAYEALIAAMELKLLDSVETSDLQEYNLDDGQMKVKTAYRSVYDVEKGIFALERAKQRLINRYNGRTSVLRSGMF